MTNKINLFEQVSGFFKGTKAAIEALPGIVEGSIGYATDTDQFGSYNGTVWAWSASGGSMPNPFALTADITPAVITASVNNYNPTGLATADVLRIEPDNDGYIITGLAGGTDGRVVIIYNLSTNFNIVFSKEHASSTAGNRFAFPFNIKLYPNRTLIIQYDVTASRWKVFSSGDATALQGIGISPLLSVAPTSGYVLYYNGDEMSLAAPSILNPISTEEIQDIVGAMVSGNVETGIAVTYDDTNGKLDLATEMVGRTGTRNLVGSNNVATPNTQYDFSADAVVLRNSSTGGIVVRTSTGTLTNNVSTAGSAANGRDQAGAFSASSWVHFYFIWNGTTLATLSSASATSPTLPSGYTHHCYLGAIRFNASSQLLTTRIMGNAAYYPGVMSNVTRVLNAGTATTSTSVSMASFVPPNALSVMLAYQASFSHATPNTLATMVIEWIQNQYFAAISLNSQVTNLIIWAAAFCEIPNLSQTVYYWWTIAGGTRAAYIDVAGYRMPNGGG